jgi:hypothetical protein
MAEALPALARRMTIRERQSFARSQLGASVALNHIHDAAENLQKAARFLDLACRARPEFVRALDGVPHADMLVIIAHDLSMVAANLEEEFS